MFGEETTPNIASFDFQSCLVWLVVAAFVAIVAGC